MSKLLRLPFALLAVLALFLLTPLSASADPPDTPTAQQCADAPDLAGCGTSQGDDAGAAGDLTAPTDEVVPPPQNKVTLPQGLAVEPLAALPVPCDAVPGIGLPDCAP